jgi:hypothetical protein
MIGGNSTAVKSKLTNVVKVFATEEAFAALTSSGQVITWGNVQVGGNSSLVADQIASGVVTMNTIESFNVDKRITPYPSAPPTASPSGVPSFVPTTQPSVPTSVPTSPTSSPTEYRKPKTSSNKSSAKGISSSNLAVAIIIPLLVVCACAYIARNHFFVPTTKDKYAATNARDIEAGNEMMYTKEGVRSLPALGGEDDDPQKQAARGAA